MWKVSLKKDVLTNIYLISKPEEKEHVNHFLFEMFSGLLEGNRTPLKLHLFSLSFLNTLLRALITSLFLKL